MKHRRAAGLAGGLLLLLFIIYIGYQVWDNLSDNIQTFDALMLTVEDKITTDGFFIREQMLVNGDASSRTAQLLAEEGEKVSKGQELAIYFENADAVSAYSSARSVENRISAMEYANKSLSGGNESPKLDGIIFKTMLEVNRELDSGTVVKADKQYASLYQLAASRGAGKTDAAAYNAEIAALKGQKADAESRISGGSVTVKAPASGYFLSGADGYENIFTPDMLDKLTPDYLAKAEPAPIAEDQLLGTIITQYDWHLAAVITEKQGAALKGKETCDVYFPQLLGSALTMDIEKITTQADGSVIVIFKSGVMQSDLLTARRESIDIVENAYTGLKIPAKALRQVDGKWGVYCLNGAVAKFKPIEIIYKTESYYLAKPAASAKEGIYLYDKIIVNAKNLQDNKVVK